MDNRSGSRQMNNQYYQAQPFKENQRYSNQYDSQKSLTQVSSNPYIQGNTVNFMAAN